MDDDGTIVTPETAPPTGSNPNAVCPYCDRPFTRERLRDLHVGERHENCTADERAAYEVAREAESEDLFTYHLKVAGGLGALYAILFLLAIVGFTL
ncbi:hypothetical protein GJR96_12190 [Haloferax sp. MBLA0076]|uniref:DUF7410 domain-containing protein n=1 Tax=Haloferax litoreum TaxID=2666140 RepID=A0A6A8GID0_9EURY|nr:MULTISPECIES: hypothetical protein [Haloferax]KAB1194859.1 hypothetical protein Hfx1148_12130 [Haloferax sp. CBA1148]MRX22706.1 hypothetical protein [Haloferax litoreum]